MHKMKLIFLKKNLLQITLCHIFLKNRHSFDHSNTTREFKKSTKQQNKKNLQFVILFVLNCDYR